MADSNTLQSNASKHPQKHSHQTVIAQFSSPLPPPEVLANYERAQEGLISKIIEMIEAESKHRRELEIEKIKAEVQSLQRGDLLISRAQIFAFLIAVITVIGGCVTATLGAQFAGGVIGTTGVAGIVVAFLKNSKREK